MITFLLILGYIPTAWYFWSRGLISAIRFSSRNNENFNLYLKAVAATRARMEAKNATRH